ncbi:carboxypeptidase regulatory-like domain-containing protein [Sphingobacterium oryzagri]|uniref:Carboxypeptidase regulatory-like domain-containing protein n=1 Tax=Sphingobacterium oryzagri TaxID=3025669 RepID=A0ABY7WBI3_9SPHI|nr:carboxypeptidase regulatory-like domain-containing protein [Sphingobacterium sp. KACC 22765]WDF66993.1 carboxypeptidase regulatory-like domain-containing protein [Sphingobacterium sp. KACC 22765]
MKKSLLFFALVLASYGTIQAQVTTSSMSGVVTESSGHATAGATIKATHLPSGTSYSGSANVAGRFNLANMRVGGPYRVEVTYVGQSPVIYEDVYLQLGQPFVLNPVFGDMGTALEEVTVTGTKSSNVNKTGASTNVGLKQIQELPQTSRSITEFTRLTPQANGNSFAGRDARYNNLQIDGANFNNGFGLSSNALPGGNAQPISLDAIEEISVNIAPFDVTQSGFTGAGINAVTKSGTNQFHGSVYGYYNNENLTGVKINKRNIQFLDGTKKNYGFSLGGPIIKDKLFFFVSAEREAATGANASGANLWRSSENGVAIPSQNITRVETADLIAVRDHLINQFGYDPGRYEGYADEAEQFGNKFLARIDWNISDKHKAAFRYNVLRGESMQVANGSSGPNPRSNFNRVSENSITFENGNYAFQNTVSSFTAELNSNFNAQLSNKFLFTYSKIQDTRTTPNRNRLFPFVDIWDGNVGSNGAVGTANYMSFGTELFSYLNDVVNDNFSFTNNLTFNTGKHSFTGGAAFEVQKFGNSYTRSGTGYYRYASVEDFLTTGTPQEVAPIMYSITYPYEGQDTYSRINFGLASLYAQDRVTLTDRFNFTVGLRAELPIYMNKLTPNPSIDALELLDVNGNPRTYSSGSWPKSRIMLSPRLGFNYDVFGDRSLTVRGGTGIFTGRVPFVWLTNMPTNAGVLQNTVEPGNYQQVAPWIGNVRFHPEDIYYHVNNVPAGAENVFIKTPREGAPSSFALVDDNFKMPSVWRTSIGADYRIPNTLVTLTTDILYTKDINAVFQYGANRKPSEQTLNYAGDNREYYPNAASYQFNPAIGANNATVLTNTNSKGHAFSATVGASIAPWHGLSGSLFYTYSEAKEVSANAGSSANSAWGGSPVISSPNEDMLRISNFALPHRVVANLSYTIQNTTLGIYYNGSHQGRYSYYYSNDLNGDGQAMDLLYLPNSANDLTFQEYTVSYRTPSNVDRTKTITVAEQREAFEKFIADNDLESYRGSYLPRNEFLMPWLNRVDIRWTQNLFNNIALRNDKLQLTVDIVNLGNLINSEWGIQTDILAAGRNVLTNRGVTNGVPTFRMLYTQDPAVQENAPQLVTTPFRPASTTGTTWSAMVGLRYAF